MCVCVCVISRTNCDDIIIIIQYVIDGREFENKYIDLCGSLKSRQLVVVEVWDTRRGLVLEWTIRNKKNIYVFGLITLYYKYDIFTFGNDLFFFFFIVKNSLRFALDIYARKIFSHNCFNSVVVEHIVLAIDSRERKEAQLPSHIYPRGIR